MKTTFCSTTLVGLFAVLFSGSIFAAGPSDPGKREFDANCASCHGLSGKGDGPMQPVLTVKPADLTVIARKNNGVFPVAQLRSVIDGRMEVNSHGSRVMPVWGDDFSVQAGNDWPHHMDAAFNPEIFVRNRILALIDYVARLQAK